MRVRLLLIGLLVVVLFCSGCCANEQGTELQQIKPYVAGTEVLRDGGYIMYYGGKLTTSYSGESAYFVIDSNTKVAGRQYYLSNNEVFRLEHLFKIHLENHGLWFEGINP